MNGPPKKGLLLFPSFIQGGDYVPVRPIEAVYEAVIEMIFILKSCHNL